RASEMLTTAFFDFLIKTLLSLYYYQSWRIFPFGRRRIVGAVTPALLYERRQSDHRAPQSLSIHRHPPRRYNPRTFHLHLVSHALSQAIEASGQQFCRHLSFRRDHDISCLVSLIIAPYLSPPLKQPAVLPSQHQATRCRRL